MAKYKKQLGKIGEEYAKKYLKDKGYTILGMNVQIGHGEIDIIAKKHRTIFFVEVKTRKSDEYVDVIDTISGEKEENLITSCEEYLAENKLDEFDYQIDLIGIIIRDGKVEKFEHVEGII